MQAGTKETPLKIESANPAPFIDGSYDELIGDITVGKQIYWAYRGATRVHNLKPEDVTNLKNGGFVLLRDDTSVLSRAKNIIGKSVIAILLGVLYPAYLLGFVLKPFAMAFHEGGEAFLKRYRGWTR